MFSSDIKLDFTPTQKTINDLKESDFTFNLTGSRYFGGATAFSDWDFYTQDNSEARSFLFSIGFSELGDFVSASVFYSDDNMACVFRLNNVDVQLVKDCSLKTRAQNKLKEILDMGFTFDTSGLNKETKAKKMWNKIYTSL